MSEKAEDSLALIFQQAVKAYDQFIVENAQLDKANREGQVSEWVRAQKARLIGDPSDSDSDSETEGERPEEMGVPETWRTWLPIAEGPRPPATGGTPG